MRILIFLWFVSALAQAKAPESLDTKLAREWERYARAQTAALAHSAKGETISRAEWEKILGTGLAAEDARALGKRQDATVEAARQRYKLSSSLDLDKLRRLGEEKVRTFCAAFPKGGMLHLHPFGTLSDAALKEILEKANPVLDAKGVTGNLYPEEFAMLKEIATRYGDKARYSDLDARDAARLRALFVLEKGVHPFSRFEMAFTLTGKWLQSNPAVDAKKIMYDDFFARAEKQHVTYAEFSEVGDLSWAPKIEGWAKDVEKRYGIVERFLYAFIRVLPPESLGERAKELLALPPNPYLVGINIVADEGEAPALERGQTGYLPILRAVKEGRSHLHIGTHAGELGDRRNPRDMLIMGAERLGHGAKLKDDMLAMEYARLHHVGVEANLTSNVRLGAVKSLAEHPFLYYLRLGLPVSLSTDDEGIFRTDINRECELAVAAFDTSYAELREMAVNSLDGAFATPATMAPLREKLERDLTSFEKSWKSAL